MMTNEESKDCTNKSVVEIPFSKINNQEYLRRIAQSCIIDRHCINQDYPLIKEQVKDSESLSISDKEVLSKKFTDFYKLSEKNHILLYGMSGDGKSMFTNYVLKENDINNIQAKVGEESCSCTMYPESFPIENLNITIVDTMGTHDTNINNTADINMGLINFVMSSGCRINKFKAIIYLHNITNTKTDHIKNYLTNLSDTLMTAIRPDNVIILFTRAGMISKKKFETLMATHRKQLEGYLLIPWDSDKEDEIEGQYEQLIDAIFECNPTDLGFMYKLEEDIENKAKELYEDDTIPVYYAIENGKKTEVAPGYAKIRQQDVYFKIDKDLVFYSTFRDNSSQSCLVSYYEALFGPNIKYLKEEKQETIDLKFEKDIDYDYYGYINELHVDIKQDHGCSVLDVKATRIKDIIKFRCVIEYTLAKITRSTAVNFGITGEIKGRRTIVDRPNLIVERRKKFNVIQKQHYEKALSILGTKAWNLYKAKHTNEIKNLLDLSRK